MGKPNTKKIQSSLWLWSRYRDDLFEKNKKNNPI
jgi:hypothetical protein